MVKSLENSERLEKLGNVLATKRKDAIDARKASGIEKVWEACEDAYLGMDDANRHEFKDAKWAKPNSMTGPITSESLYQDDSRSTAYVRLTSRYVDAGAAKLSEILLPANEKAFSFSPTPIPDLIEAKEDPTPAVTAQGAPITRPATPEELGGMTDATAVPPVAPVTHSDLAMHLMNEASKKAKKAETQVSDWLVECGYRAENRKVIHDAARLGVGILKGPFAVERKAQAVRKDKMTGEIVVSHFEKIAPAAKWIDPWNVFPDGACGENIHHGDYIFERDFLAPRLLKDLKKRKGYIAEQIDKVLKEGPSKQLEDSKNPNEEDKKSRFVVWYYYGTISREDMAVAEAVGVESLPEDVTEVYAIITMVNDTVIRATINPLESGRFPYDAMPWSRRAGSWAGVGVAEQVNMPQRMCNAATRSLLNNAGYSCGPQIIIDRQAITPASINDWTIRPNKIWFKEPDSILDDVRKAFMAVEIPNVGDQMMKVIEYAFKLAEEATNIPLISQGQTGPTTPETLGATQLQNNNANTLLRSIGYSYDDYITEPKVQAFYEWLLLDPNVPEDTKGEYLIDAHGSVAMVERAIQDQTLAQMGQMVLDPNFGMDPKKWMQEWMRSKHLDPTLMEVSEDEQKKKAEAPPPEAPQVTVAKINATSREKIAGFQAQGEGGEAAPEQPEVDHSLEIAKIKADVEIHKHRMAEESAALDRQFKQHQAEVQHAHELRMKEMDREIAEIKAQYDRQSQLDAVKTSLAETTITEDTKKELAQAEIDLAVTLDDSSKNHDREMNPPSLIRDEVNNEGTP